MHPSSGSCKHTQNQTFLILEDGSIFAGRPFGALRETAGEVVFNTGMVGYPESFTDPSYCGQLLALTYPLIGNYGVPADMGRELAHTYESTRIHMEGLVVSEYSEFHHHWSAEKGLSNLLKEQNIAGIQGVDTRALTKKLREHGTMRGRITTTQLGGVAAETIPERHMVSEVSVDVPRIYEANKFAKCARGKRVAVVDCGCKHTIIKNLLYRGLDVVRMPWNSKFTDIQADGILFSNGPGDPQACSTTVELARQAIEHGVPTFGICLGNQIVAMAAGADTYKLKFGHRSQNQPCKLTGSPRFFVTSQNHGYAVKTETLPSGWEVWFENVNDGTNEGIRHATKPVMSVQFHPEAMPGPVDTGFLFDEFVSLL